VSAATELRGAAIEPREIQQEGDAGFRVAWADGLVSRYDAPNLRRACPCAQCVNEWTGERTLRPEAIADDLTIREFSLVGRYAINFQWSDGHDSGIYSFRYLRERSESTAPSQ
jgi:DUF971 family protein